MRKVTAKSALSLNLVLCSLLVLSSISAPLGVRADSPKTVVFQVNGKPYNFTLTTDSSTTLSPITNYGETKFNFTFTGTGTGWANATVCKTSGTFPPGQAHPDKIKIYINDTRVPDTNITVQNVIPSQPVTCVWVYWTFHHSTDNITMDLTLAVPLQAPAFDNALLVLAASTLLVGQYAILRQRRNRRH